MNSEDYKQQTRIRLKNIQTNKDLSQETFCYSASLYFDGVKVGRVSNDGHGGPDHFEISNDKLKEIENYCETFKPVESYGMSMQPTLEWVTNQLVSDHLDRAEDLKMVRGKTVFRLKSEEYQDHEWLVLKRKFDAQSKAALVKQYGDDLGEILNETLKSGSRQLTERV